MLVTQNDVNVNAHQQQITTVKKTKESYATLNPRNFICIIVSKVAKLDLKISQTRLKVPELELILEKLVSRDNLLIFDQCCKGLYFQSELSR